MRALFLAVQRSIVHPQRSTLARTIMRPLAATLGLMLIGASGAGAAFYATAAAAAPHPSVGVYGPGSQDSPPVQAAAEASIVIHIKNFAFEPGTLTVKPDQQVTWVNDDPVPHTATNVAKVWDTGQLQPRATFSTIFTKPGVYLYNCTVHPFMQAKIIVSP
jgi:plastocyanin